MNWAEVATAEFWFRWIQIVILDLTLAGLGWATTPRVLAAPHLAAGRLVELAPRRPIAVTLYWQRTRLAARLLDQLTRAVRATAAQALTAGQA